MSKIEREESDMAGDLQAAVFIVGLLLVLIGILWRAI